MALSNYTPAADKIVHTTNVDFTRRSYISAPIRLVQYDNKTPIIAVTLYKDNEPYTIPSGYDANIRVGRKERKYVYNPALGCNADRNILYFEITNAMVMDYGKQPVIVELMNGENVAGSSTFIFDVDRNPMQLSDIDTSSEGKSLVDYVKDAQTARDAAVAANTTAQEAKNEAVSANEAAQEAKDAIQETEYQLENAIGDINDANLRMSGIEDQFAALSLLLGNKIDGGYADEDGYLYLTSEEAIVAGPIGPFAGGSGGGGGAGNNAVLTLTNSTGWMAKTVAKGATCEIKVTWSSIEQDMPTGPGVLTVRINNIPKLTKTVQQGEITVDMTDILVTGQNQVKISVSDQYGNSRTIVFTITAVELILTSSFAANTKFTSDIQYTYTPIGSGAKTVHFLVDGSERSTATVTSSNRQQTYVIRQLTHGHHEFEVYFTATINEETVESNHLYYDLIYVEAGKNDIIFATPYNTKTVEQYDTIVIPWYVYDPQNLQVDVDIYVNEGLASHQTGVGRTEQTYSFRANKAGQLTVKFQSGKYSRTLTLTVTESEIEIEAVTENLALYLTSEGRSNNEDEPAKWEYNDISAVFNESFNWVTDGWVTDNDGNTVLRLTRGDTVEIPYKIFDKDFRSTGKTIEFEFSTSDCGKYNDEIISARPQSGSFPGVSISTNQMQFGSTSANFAYPYKEEEHIRLSIVVDKSNENRLMTMYVNGIMSAAMQYSDNDNFAQIGPGNIMIAATNETIDIYNIRVYDNNLNRDQILDNWIADTQDGGLLRDRYTRNKIFDEYSKIVIDSLPNDLPYFVFVAEELPEFKGDKKDVDGSFTNKVQTSKSFTFTGAKADVQGTSSAGYTRKNYKVKFSKFVSSTGESDTYAMKENSIPVNTFTFKADVASSEGANNICLAQLYNDICTYQTPPQKKDNKVRQGIDGFAMVVFQTKSGDTQFIGKYNFNNDKGTQEVFGFNEGDESWEVLNNTSSRVLFSPDADYTNDEQMAVDFEGRYPDENDDFTNLKVMFEEAKTKLTTKEGIADLFEIESAKFYYLFTEMFLMVDSRAKNMFLTKYTGEKWCFLPYDFDTALGINNEGSLTFPYWLEDSDVLGDNGTKVFNGQDSVLWTKFRDFYKNEIAALYQQLRSGGKFSYDTVEQRFEEHQSKWSEAIFNEDAWFKYIEPLVDSSEAMYLPMLQGSKAEQRKWWLYNRFKYMDSKYVAGESLTNAITLRGYAKDDISVKVYAPTYVSIKYGSDTETHRFKNVAETYKFQCKLTNLNDTEIYVYSADFVTNISDLSGLNVGQADFSKAVRLSEIFIGNGTDISTVCDGLYVGAFDERTWKDDYTNTNLKQLNVGNNRQLMAIDARNCVNLAGPVDLRGCEFLRGVRFDGCTTLQSIDLPNGAPIEDLYFPPNSVSVIVKNLGVLKSDNFTEVMKKNLVTTLQIENTPKLMTEITEDLLTQYLTAGSRLRLVGFNITILTGTESDQTDAIEAKVDEWLTLFDTYAGLDENGGNTDKAQIIGTWLLYSVTGTGLARFKEKYPGITFDYQHVSSKITYYNYDGTQLWEETVLDNGDGNYKGTTPTREATAQYKYTFSGWTTEFGSNDVEADALKNIGADRKVYACFSSEIQKYTVRFYNDSTLLYTALNVPYGSIATYAGSTSTSNLKKSGVDDPENYKFNGWVPSNTNIQKNTDCKVDWLYTGLTETLGAYSWQQIADICTAGLADVVFKQHSTDADGDIKIAKGNGDIVGSTGIDMELVIAKNDNYQNYIAANTIWISKHLVKKTARFTSSNDDGAWYPYSQEQINNKIYEHALEELNIPNRIDVSDTAPQSLSNTFITLYGGQEEATKTFVGGTNNQYYWIPRSVNIEYSSTVSTSAINYTGNGMSSTVGSIYYIPVAFGLGDPARCHEYNEAEMKAAIADGSYKETYKLGDVVVNDSYGKKYIGVIVSHDYNSTGFTILFLYMITGAAIQPLISYTTYVQRFSIYSTANPTIYLDVPSVEILNLTSMASYSSAEKLDDKPFDLFTNTNFIDYFDRSFVINSNNVTSDHRIWLKNEHFINNMTACCISIRNPNSLKFNSKSNTEFVIGYIHITND